MRAAGLLLLLVHSVAAGAEPAPYVVIVHSSNRVASADRKFLADAFLKKTSRWGDGEAIRPVDQTAGAPARRRFTESILRRSVAAVKSYWQQAIFSGRDVPPPELAGDRDVVKYVLEHPGAIGYVSGDTPLDGVKILVVR